MVLATRCPHCRTTFRVVQDQLKLRGGLVRCGACKEIFNGTENLLRPMDAAAAHPARPAAATETDITSVAAPAVMHQQPLPQPPDAPAPVQASPAEPSTQPQSDPLLRMTLMDFSSFHDEADKADEDMQQPASADYSLPRKAAAPAPVSSPPDSADDLGRVIEDMKSKPWRGMTGKRARADEDAIDALDSAEPDFVVRARYRQRRAQSTRIAMLAGSAVLALLLAVQLVAYFRVQLAAQSPALATTLAAVCRLAGCTVGLPAHIDMVTIESSELQALPGSTDSYTLVALLRNRSATRQQWPHIELTLNDANDAAVARRVIAPRDYLPASQDPAEGFAANSEQSARLVFSLAQLKAAGFRVYLFYP